MNKIDKEELFEQLSRFLKTKGIELQEGPYTRTIHKSCQVLADTLNLSQQAMERARVEVERSLEQVREAMHRKTAPRKPPVQPRTGAASAQASQATPEPPKRPSRRTPKVLPKRQARKPSE